jgi:hypothetical protein
MSHTDMGIVGATTGVLPVFPRAFKAGHRQRP